MLTLIIAVTLFASSHLAAQDTPLPEALMTAKTAIAVNAGVSQDYYERVILELRDMKRFTLETTIRVRTLRSPSKARTQWESTR